MTIRNILGGAAALVIVAAAAGCGGSSTSSGSGAPTSPATSAGHPSSSTSGTPSSGSHTPVKDQPTSHATEFNPPGDIPDNQVFVDFRAAGSTVHIRVPEGWARSSAAGATTFTDHYNTIAIQVVPAASRPTEASARAKDVPALRGSVPRFANPQVSTVKRQHGTAIRIVYQLDSPPNDVTGKVVRDTAERYEFWQQGQEAVLTLTGPRGADNVDPWRTVSDSLRWQ